MIGFYVDRDLKENTIQSPFSPRCFLPHKDHEIANQSHVKSARTQKKYFEM